MSGMMKRAGLRPRTRLSALLLVTTGLVAPVLFATSASGAEADAKKTTGQSAAEISELVVTAQKREENLQKVPVAVTAFSAEKRDITGVDTLEQIANMTPGMTYSQSEDRVNLRGIARQAPGLAVDTSTAIFVDGFYTTSGTDAARPPLLVQNIEVLRGPQGTLFGRNSIAGDLLITSTRPSSKPFAEVRATAGNFGLVDTQFAVSGPVADGLNARLAGWATHQSEGYFKNAATGGTEGGKENFYYLEPSMTAKFGDSADLYLKAALAHRRDSYGPGSKVAYQAGNYDAGLFDSSSSIYFNPAAIYTNLPGGSAAYGITNAVQLNPNITGNPGVTNPRSFSANTPNFVYLDQKVIDTIFTYHLPGFDIKYTGGFEKYRSGYQQEGDDTDVLSYVLPCNKGDVTCAANGPLTVYPQIVSTYREDHQWYSHEVNFISTSNGPLQWVAGLYYFDERFTTPHNSIGTPLQTQLLHPVLLTGANAPLNATDCLQCSNIVGRSRSEAAYGQIDWQVTDTLKFTAGLRYTSDRKVAEEYARTITFGAPSAEKFYIGASPFPALGNISYGHLGNGTYAIDSTACPAPLPGGIIAPGVKSACVVDPVTGVASRALGADFSATTGTAGLAWTPTKDILAYVRYSRGYKAGATNDGSFSAVPLAGPEFINAYEVGWKQTFGSNLVIDADVFYYDFIDAQFLVGTANPLVPGTFTALLDNIPKTRIDGVEVEAIWTPINKLEVDLSYAFNDTAILTSCNIGTGFGCFINTNDPVNSKTPVSVKGDQLPNAPRNKVSLTSNYTFEFEAGRLILSGTYIWRDRQFSSIFNDLNQAAPSWSQVDLRATWKAANDRYELVAFGRNVFNTTGYPFGANAKLYQASADPALGLPAGPISVNQKLSPNPPATYGVEVHYRFF